MKLSRMVKAGDLFGVGVRTETGHLVASPEKAPCDYLYTRPNLRITSPKTLASCLEEDVRFDFDEFHVKIVIRGEAR